MQGEGSWLRKGCSTHPAKPITASTVARLSGRLAACFSRFPRPPEGHASTWWQRPPRQPQLSHQGTEPAHSAAVAMGAETVHTAPSSAHTAASHLRISLTPGHASPRRICCLSHSLQLGTSLLCPPMHSATRSCPAFLGRSWIVTLLVLVSEEGKYVSQLLTVV